MIHPATELRFISPTIGSGVFATKLIPRGTITWTQCALDRVLTTEEARALGPSYQPILERYAYQNARGDHVLCWDLGRFMNHSCRPAVLSPGFDVDVAIRDVLPGEELTCDYALLNLDDEMDCSCGAPGCRQRIRLDDPSRLLAGWDEQVRLAFASVGDVEQPLWPFLRQQDEIAAAARGDVPVPSCGRHLRKR
jgi:hypothetical protein